MFIKIVTILGLTHWWSIDFRFSIFDFRGDPTDKCGGLRIFDFRFWIDSTDKSGGLYYQEIRLSEISRQSIANFPQISTKAAQSTVFPVRNLLRVDRASPNSSAQALWLPKPLCWRANLACLMESLRTLSDRHTAYPLQSYTDFSRLRERQNGFCYELAGHWVAIALFFLSQKLSRIS